jgi:hypothetical protein
MQVPAGIDEQIMPKFGFKVYFLLSLLVYSACRLLLQQRLSAGLPAMLGRMPQVALLTCQALLSCDSGLTC